jgi:hypothetical protein
MPRRRLQEEEAAGVVRVNISIASGLKSRMEAVTVPVNWSAVAAQAFETKLLELASKKEVGSTEDVIARLKAAGELDDKDDYQAGFAAGERWAKQAARPKQLRRLEEYHAACAAEGSEWFDVNRPDWPAPWGATGRFALRMLGMDPDVADVADRRVARNFWRSALGTDAERINDANFFRGFGEGAEAVWQEVKDEL